ncbi:MAG: hypothetical protein AAFX44_14615 [Pseudomonadota bacterium]
MKDVRFTHVVDPPLAEDELTALTADHAHVPGLCDFYATSGAVALFFDAASKESAYYIGPPSQWHVFRDGLFGWFEGLTQAEEKQLLPAWVDDSYVLGTIPGSGNYLVVPGTGEESGAVFLFDHDGFEFLKLAETLPAFVAEACNPGDEALTSIATGMRFVECESDDEQWWIVELRNDFDEVVASTHT